MGRLADVMARALGYPYEAPADSYLLTPEGARTDPGLLPEPALADGRTPLLAYGSNAAPEVLARKLGATLGPSPVPALRTTLADFDVVYSAHVSRYGSIPATLQRSPGTSVPVFVVYLTGEQLDLISPTEPNYELVGLRGASCALRDGEGLSGVTAYLSRHGALLAAGSEVALAAIPARDRRLPAMAQAEALEHVRARVAPELSLERFVAEAAADPSLAARRTEALKRSQTSG